MNLTKLASEGYDLKVRMADGIFEFKSKEFNNANQLHKLLSERLTGFSQLKKSIFYGVKFEETAPGVFVGEHRIAGQGFFTFSFFGEGTITATGDRCCDGRGSCVTVCCKSSTPLVEEVEVVVSATEAANESQFEIEPRFMIGELGAGCLTVSDKMGRLQSQHRFSGLEDPEGKFQTILGFIDSKQEPGYTGTPTFFYQEMSGEYISVYRGFLLSFSKGRPTLKETFLGWLKNILG